MASRQMLDSSRHSTPPVAGATMSKIRPITGRFNPRDFGTVEDLSVSTNHDVADVLVIGCCDQAESLDNISIIHSNRTVIVQNLGGSVPLPSSKNEEATLAGIEFAVQHLNVAHAIVCSHVPCRVITAWSAAGEHDRFKDCCQAQRLRRWVLPQVDRTHPDASSEQRLRYVTEEHVLQQLETLQVQSCVQTAVQAGRLLLHGWIVDERTARVDIYVPEAGQFVLA